MTGDTSIASDTDRSDPDREVQRHAVYTIEPGTPFLPCLAERLLDGCLTGGVRSPEELARTTVFLPNRRAVGGLWEALAEHARRLGQNAIILPKITALSDVDEEALELALHEDESEALEALDPAWIGGEARLPLQPTCGQLDRQLTLTRLIMRWGDEVGRVLFHPGTDVPLLLPKGPADAAIMAFELSRLLDEFQAQDIPRDVLDDIVPEQLAEYWALSHRFLTIVLEWWERELAEEEKLDPIARRNALILAQAAHLESARPTDPMIIAGSTGSVPATARLMKAVLGLPRGVLVLPGLDTVMDQTAWRMIAPPRTQKADSASRSGDQEQGDPGHPQHGLKRLVDGLDVAREAVLPLRTKTAGAPVRGRTRLISETFRTARATAQWPDALADFEGIDAALRGLSIIDAENERLEALAVAICLRAVLADPNTQKTAFLVTPDRMLARRVSAELGRWGIVLDDSAGRPLTATAQGRCLMAMAGLVGGDVGGNLLAVLRSGFVRRGLPARRAENAVDAIELLALRSGRDCTTLASVQSAFQAGARQWRDGEWLHPITRRLTAQAIDDADSILADFTRHLGQTPEDARPFAELVMRHIALAESLGRDEQDMVTLWAGAFGARLHAELRRIAEAAAKAPDLLPDTYTDFLRTLLMGIKLPADARGGRIAILGPLEARLQSADLIILGGLNEGSWPGEADTDPWLSRSMRTMAGLEAPERRIGLAAHDVSQAMGAPEVILTRARRTMNSPTVASRWLQRLDAVAGEKNALAMRDRGAQWLKLAEALERAERFEPQCQPLPKPRVESRPRQMSVTRIETLIRDPYAIYARQVLRLQPLDPLQTLGEPIENQRLRGTIIHAALADALRQAPERDIAAAFRAAANDAMAEFGLTAAAQELWRTRLDRIGQWLARAEHDTHANSVTQLLEIDGTITLDGQAGPFTLTARADRIDILKDGTARIIDYKTGAPPTGKQVHSLLSPQLPLEALILSRGGFADAGTTMIGPDKEALTYWKVTGGIPPADRSAVGQADSVADAEALLNDIVAYYDEPAHGYRPRVALAQERYGSDYDHLSRFGEWSISGIGEGSE